jgi:hypothetical protein
MPPPMVSLSSCSPCLAIVLAIQAFDWPLKRVSMDWARSKRLKGVRWMSSSVLLLKWERWDVLIDKLWSRTGERSYRSASRGRGKRRKVKLRTVQLGSLFVSSSCFEGSFHCS